VRPEAHTTPVADDVLGLDERRGVVVEGVLADRVEVGVAGLAELGQAKAAQVRAVDPGVAGDVLFLLVDELASRSSLPRPEEAP